MYISKNANNIVYPCKICHVNINNKDSAAQCDICQSWAHIKCNKLNHIDYKYLQGSYEPWYCLSCCSEIFPFGTLTNKDFFLSISTSLSTRYQEWWKLAFTKTSLWLGSHFDQIQTLKFPNKYKSLALFHINACSLNKNFDDLEHLLKCTNKVFDMIAVTETRITKQTSLNTNINLRNYAIEFTPAESLDGATLLYIASHFSYKPRAELNI